LAQTLYMELEAPPVPRTPLCCIFPGPRGPISYTPVPLEERKRRGPRPATCTQDGITRYSDWKVGLREGGGIASNKDVRRLFFTLFTLSC
jgi:hypothetical protein